MTARERARKYLRYWGVADHAGRDQERGLIRMLRAHARAAVIDVLIRAGMPPRRKARKAAGR